MCSVKARSNYSELVLNGDGMMSFYLHENSFRIQRVSYQRIPLEFFENFVQVYQSKNYF